MAVVLALTSGSVLANELDLNFSNTQGGMALGGGYTIKSSVRHGYGGHLRVVPENDDPEKLQTGLTVLGGHMKVYGSGGPLGWFMAAGGSLLMIDPPFGDSETALGSSLGFGLLHRVGRSASVGVDLWHYQPWTGDEGRGGFSFMSLVLSLGV